MIREHFSPVAWLKSSNQGLRSVPETLRGLSAGLIQQLLRQKQIIHLATLTLYKNKTAKRLPNHDSQWAKQRIYINACYIIWGMWKLKDLLYAWSTIFHSLRPYMPVCCLIMHRHWNKYFMKLLKWFSKLKYPNQIFRYTTFCHSHWMIYLITNKIKQWWAFKLLCIFDNGENTYFLFKSATISEGQIVKENKDLLSNTGHKGWDEMWNGLFAWR